MNNTLLDIENLKVKFKVENGEVLAVRDINLKISSGETIGIVGESGCGKTVTAYSILRLIRPPGEIVSGKIHYRGRDLLSLDEDQIRDIRGREISMIFQEPMTSLNPVFSAGFQLKEAVGRMPGLTNKEIRERSIALLDTVGIPSPEKRIDSFPHEFSGGMRQRIMIAMALAASPSLLIADEPTTALDVTIQAQILDLLLDIQKKNSMSLMLITHDLGIVANTSDRIAVMYAGEIVESGSSKDIFTNPLHPYTIGLFEALPRIGSGTKRLKTISGSVPVVTADSLICSFYPRCPMADSGCAATPVINAEIDNDRTVRCLKVSSLTPGIEIKP